ncbi:MAG TPA: efflux transporter outer membrane subunit [Steroidobacteraceae bacterium]|jgi:NodT family efflux transporter outer membrane factor (OMF) lipoprotein|nr:efflux transporter outer membrane subunit [Steroidobacteraceae bacterium]
MRNQTILAVVCALATASCATPGHSPDPIPLQDPAALTATQTLASADKASAPTDQWWHEYGDPQLDALVKRSIEASPTLDVAVARAREAEAALESARGRTFPTVGAQVAMPYERQSENGLIPPPYAGSSEWNPDARLSLSYLLDFWGRNRAALAASLSAVRAAGYEAEAIRQTLISQIVSTYVSYAGNFGQQKLAEQLVDARKTQLELTQQRVNAGVDTQAELRAAEAALAQARAELAGQEEKVTSAKLALVALAGEGPDDASGLQPPALHSPRFGLPSQLPAELLGRRPDVAAVREQIETAEQQVKVARTEFYPNINLSAFVGLSSYGLDNWLKAGSRIAGVTPAISLPIFDAGQRRANLRGREAQRDSAIATYNAVLERALYEVANTLSQLKSVDIQRPQLDQAVDAAADAWRIARLRYERGLGNYLTVVNAEAQWISASRARVDLDSKALSAAAALARAVGGGWQPG